MNLCLLFSMVVTGGSGSIAGGLGGGEPVRLVVLDDEIRNLITVEVVAAVQGAMSEMFGSVKTVMIKLFDERYVVVTDATIAVAAVAIATARVGGSF